MVYVLSKAVSARIKGDDYQACFFWIKACGLFQEHSNIDIIEYESSQIKSLDDIVIHYKKPCIDCYGESIYSDYFQVKFHVAQSGTFTWQDLLDPTFINATSVSFLQRLYDAQKKFAPDGKGIRFFLVSPWNIHPDNELASIVSNTEGEILWNKLSVGGINSKMGKIREKMKEHLGLDTDEELKIVLRPLRISHSMENNIHLRQTLKTQLLLSGLQPLDDSSFINPYSELIKSLLLKGRQKFTKKDLENICKNEGLWVGHDLKSLQTNPIGIRSFYNWAENMESETPKMLCLLEFFNGRKLKDPKYWNNRIPDKLEEFLADAIETNIPNHIHFDTHSSIAFMAGYTLDSKTGVEVIPIQKFNGKILWRPNKEKVYEDYPGWNYQEKIVDVNSNDTVITLGVRHKIINEVNFYLEKLNMSVYRIVNCTLDNGQGAGVVQDGTHAWLLADKIANFINDRPFKERLGHLHIFSAVPNGLMFFLGQFARSFGRFTLYEYDFDNRSIPGNYEPSISFPIKNGCR